jgi:Flp pilus assembly protein TadG
MIIHHRAARRRGAVAIESALIMSAMFLFILGVIVLGMGVFRYQEVGYLAREGTRWASVHGTQYATDTGNAAASATDVYNNAIAPKLAALDATQLTYSVSWSTSNAPYYTYTDVNNNVVKVANTVTVTVNYHWVPEAYFGGVTLSSTSVMPMSN